MKSKEITSTLNKKMANMTLAVFIYNGGETLNSVLNSIERQKHREMIYEILLVDDNSCDESLKIIKNYMKKSTYHVRLVEHSTNMGLANGYNEALRLATTKYVILMHQDIELTDKDSFKKIYEPFELYTECIASYPGFIYPYSAWAKNGIWQQALFSRLVGKEIHRLNGKFDCLKRLEVPYFESGIYRTAGEDFDFEIRAKQKGTLAAAQLLVDHVQSKEENFPLKKLVKKEIQLAECYGVNLRRHYDEMKILDITLILVRPILIVLLFIPLGGLQLAVVSAMAIFVVSYTWNAFISNINKPKAYLLPFVNIFLVIAYSYYLLKGVIYAKATI